MGDAQVTLTEFDVKPSVKTLPQEGVYSFGVVNEGEVPHALVVEGPNGESRTDRIAPGESTKLEAYLVSGRYELYCPIADHEQKGMTAKLTVKR